MLADSQNNMRNVFENDILEDDPNTILKNQKAVKIILKIREDGMQTKACRIF